MASPLQKKITINGRSTCYCVTLVRHSEHKAWFNIYAYDPELPYYDESVDAMIDRCSVPMSYNDIYATVNSKYNSDSGRMDGAIYGHTFEDDFKADEILIISTLVHGFGLYE